MKKEISSLKSYLRRSPLLIPTMVFGGAFLCAAAAAALYIFTRKLSIICIGLCVVLLILWLFVILAVQHRYRYSDDGITFCLGIFWFDSLRELLSRTSGTVYLLEDVYLRFQSSFDEIMKPGQIDKSRIQIISI